MNSSEAPALPPYWEAAPPVTVVVATVSLVTVPVVVVGRDVVVVLVRVVWVVTVVTPVSGVVVVWAFLAATRPTIRRSKFHSRMRMPRIAVIVPKGEVGLIAALYSVHQLMNLDLGQKV